MKNKYLDANFQIWKNRDLQNHQLIKVNRILMGKYGFKRIGKLSIIFIFSYLQTLSNIVLLSSFIGTAP